MSRFVGAGLRAGVLGLRWLLERRQGGKNTTKWAQKNWETRPPLKFVLDWPVRLPKEEERGISIVISSKMQSSMLVITPVNYKLSFGISKKSEE
jgi:hypothetical protein